MILAMPESAVTKSRQLQHAPAHDRRKCGSKGTNDWIAGELAR